MRGKNPRQKRGGESVGYRAAVPGGFSGALNLACKAAALLAVSGLALFAPASLNGILSFAFPFAKVYQVAWLLLMLGMARLMIPALNRGISSGKVFSRHFRAGSSGNRTEAIAAYTRKNNRAAFRAGLFWIGILSMVAVFYFLVFRSWVFILLAVTFFYFFDEFCITVWCPFRSWIVRNKCCNSCRIYAWGTFMIVSPLVFLPTFWTWSLVAMSLAVMAQWEYLHARHPHRFSELANLNLQCGSCSKGNCRFLLKRRASSFVANGPSPRLQ